MTIVSWIAVGGFAGLVVESLVTGCFPNGRFGAVTIGAGGGLVGGGVFAVLDGRGVVMFDPVTALSALAGAAVLLVAMHEADNREARLE